MTLTLRIPLCWKGKRVYVPKNDEFLGGWLWAWARLKTERMPYPSGIRITLTWGVGLRT